MSDLERLPVIRFILQFDQQGGLNFGAGGIPEEVADRLRRMKVIEVWNYKPQSSPVNKYGRRKVPRRYRMITAGDRMPRLAQLIREELRNRNLPSVDGIMDGVGRVALTEAWNTRRTDVKKAIRAAWNRYLAELLPDQGDPTCP